MRYITTILSFLSVFHVNPALSKEASGMAEPWQLGMQPPVTPVMEQLFATHHYLLILITAISLLVLFLLMYICLRFNRRANPNPSKNAHNTKLEIIWTTIPVIVLIAIAIPSLRVHYFIEDDDNAEMTLKVVGYQWYWHYEYPDFGGFGFDSYMKKKEDLAPGDIRNLSVDNQVVVPVDTKIRVLMTAGDVIHSWAVPAFGVKRDAVPGRLNSSWFKATKTGTYYGQCSELCGVGHGFMPIRVDVVDKEEFKRWVAGKQHEAGISAPANSKEEVKEPQQEKHASKLEKQNQQNIGQPVDPKKLNALEPAAGKVRKTAASVQAKRTKKDDVVSAEEGWGENQ